MPKSKEFVDSDDSSASGSSSEAEKKGKKRQKKEMKKSEAKGESSSKKSKKDEKEPIWELGKLSRLTVREFKGKVLIDLRNYYEDKDGELKPTKKGIALNPEQWRKLKEIFEEVDEIVKERC